MYQLSVLYCECGDWLDTCEPLEEFETLDEAKAAAEDCKDCDFGEGEFCASIHDEDGAEVWSTEWRVDHEQLDEPTKINIRDFWASVWDVIKEFGDELPDNKEEFIEKCIGIGTPEFEGVEFTGYPSWILA